MAIEVVTCWLQEPAAQLLLQAAVVLEQRLPTLTAILFRLVQELQTAVVETEYPIVF
jgi:hypothetical protein